MPGLIFGARVAAVGGKEEGGVDHPEIGSAELGFEPFGGDEGVHSILALH
jgi:hypothetical protein